MEWILILLIALCVVWRFADVLLLIAVRMVGFLICLGLAINFQQHAAAFVLWLDITADDAVAQFIGFIGTLAVTCCIFRWTVHRCRKGRLSGSEVVAIDVVRSGLAIAVVIAALVMLISAARGAPVDISWWALLVIALAIACVDVLFPSFLGRVAAIGGGRPKNSPMAGGGK